jgi:hypothetical protein
MSQIVERFEAAVQTLVGDGPVKNRLLAAYTEHLEDLQQVDLPIESKLDFGDLHAALHRASTIGKIDRVRASVQKMSPAEAWWHAQTIVRLYTEVLAMERRTRIEVETTINAVEDGPPRHLLARRN